MLSALYGVPVREIAASLGLNPNTVASRLRATRSRLKALASAADLENLTREDTPPEKAKARVLAGLCPLLVPPSKPAAFYGLKVAFVGLCVAGSVALLTSPQPAGTASPFPDEVFASHKVDAPGLVEPTIPDAPAVLEIQDDPRPAHTLRPPRPRAASPAVRVAPVIPVAPVVPGPSTASAPVDDVRAELALVTEARTAVRQGKPTVALRTANRYASRFPHGVLQTEMAVVRVDSLCRLGREEDASVVAGTLRGLHARPPTSVCPR